MKEILYFLIKAFSYYGRHDDNSKGNDNSKYHDIFFMYNKPDNNIFN